MQFDTTEPVLNSNKPTRIHIKDEAEDCLSLNCAFCPGNFPSLPIALHDRFVEVFANLLADTIWQQSR